MKILSPNIFWEEPYKDKWEYENIRRLIKERDEARTTDVERTQRIDMILMRELKELGFKDIGLK